MFTAAFWKDALERAIKTAAQAALAYLGTVAAVDDFTAQWDTAALSIGIATAASLLTSIVSSRVGSPTDASLVDGSGK